MEQRDSEGVLEGGDVPADRGLAEIDLGGRTAEAVMVNDRQENLELSEFHPSTTCRER